MRTTLAVAALAAAVAIPACAMAADDHHATVQPEALKWSAPAA